MYPSQLSIGKNVIPKKKKEDNHPVCEILKELVYHFSLLKKKNVSVSDKLRSLNYNYVFVVVLSYICASMKQISYEIFFLLQVIYHVAASSHH